MKRVQFLIPVLLCFLGIYFTFFQFWNGFDAITGDIGDARFNSFVLEHTWLWLKGVHSSLFDMPMFYPHTNTYAYSDFMLGTAPIYWLFRSVGNEILLSYQWWLMVCAALNFFVFHQMAKKYFHQSSVFSSIGAFVFAFSLPRITHLEHAQLVAQFFILLSAMGAMEWWKNPSSKKAPWMFMSGAVLQFISAFYFFWFWVWTLAVMAVYVSWSAERRAKLKSWLREVPLNNLIFPVILNGIIAAPFLYHYALSASEFGRRDWVTISNSVPRLYSWINLPQDHWEWNLLPFQNWIKQLPMIHEHFLSFGLLTWIGMILSLVYLVRRKSEWKFLAVPLIAMFLFTLTSGRFSTWVFMSYLFPGGGVIRAVSRIQIFMLLFWSLSIMIYLSKNWDSGKKQKQIGVGLFLIAFFGENIYFSNWVFSRSQEQVRLEALAQKVPADCEVLVNPEGFKPHADFINIDMVMLAFQTHRMTMNGYSGHEPKDYLESMNMIPEISKTKKTCTIE